MPAHPFRNRHPNRVTSVVTRMGGRSIRGNTSAVWTSDARVRLPAGKNVCFPGWPLTAGRVPAWTIGRNEGGGNGVGVARRPSIRHAFRRGGERGLEPPLPPHEPAVRGPLHRKGDDRGDARDIPRISWLRTQGIAILVSSGCRPVFFKRRSAATGNRSPLSFVTNGLRWMRSIAGPKRHARTPGNALGAAHR